MMKWSRCALLGATCPFCLVRVSVCAHASPPPETSGGKPASPRAAVGGVVTPPLIGAHPSANMKIYNLLQLGVVHFPCRGSWVSHFWKKLVPANTVPKMKLIKIYIYCFSYRLISD